MLFTECNIKQGLLKALDEMGYIKMTEIQEKILVPALTGKNIVGQSQTGTGKTTAFLLPLLQRIDTNKKGLQALILAPTRELVNQIGEEIFALTKYYRVNAVCVFGGASLGGQKIKLQKNPSIIVATPGRLMDFMNQKVINIAPVEFFVLDEVDRMLDMGFVRDIRKIRDQLKNVKQTYTFSATISDEIKKIINEYIPGYESIKVGSEVTVDKIHHSYMQVEHEDKLFNAKKLIDEHPMDKILIFTQTKRNTKSISTTLGAEGYKIAMLNGDMSQGKRTATLNGFKAGTTRILVTTDVAARGLNMDNVGLVINFDVPKDTESYIHRIGRTGRAGAKGKAIILVSDLEIPLVKDIEHVHKMKIRQSEQASLRDERGKYAHVRLNRSTDKQGVRIPRAGRPGDKKPSLTGKPERKPFPGKPFGRPAFGKPTYGRPERTGFGGKPSFGKPEKKYERERGGKPSFGKPTYNKTDRKPSGPRKGPFRGLGTGQTKVRR